MNTIGIRLRVRAVLGNRNRFTILGIVVICALIFGQFSTSHIANAQSSGGSIFLPLMSGGAQGNNISPNIPEENHSSVVPEAEEAPVENADRMLVHAADGNGNVDSVTGAVCMQDVYDSFGQGGSLNCTANDIQLATASNIIIQDDGCAFPGDTVTFTADFDVIVTANARHDVGIYFSLDGDPNGDGALTGQCTVSTPAYAPNGPWVDLDELDDNTVNSNDFGYCSPDGGATRVSPNTPCDGGSPAAGDAQCVAALGAGHTCEEFGDGVGVTGDPIQDTCGDINSASNPLQPSISLTVACVDDDGDGQLDLPYCSSWRQPGGNELCTTPLAAYPGTVSKCNCDEGFGIAIAVPGQIIVDKVTDPAGDTTSFDFTLSGADGDLPANFSLTDGAAPFASPGLDAGTYSVTEAANASYTTTATCDDGSDPSAIDLQSGETVTCTFTNTLAQSAPDIALVKTANPTQVNEPGGSVVFTVDITNNGDEGTIDSLIDDIHGDLTTSCVDGTSTPLVGQTIGAGETLTCTFTATVSGNAGDSETDTVTTVVSNDAGSDTASDTATVDIVDVASAIEIIKTADPIQVSEPGGDVTFSFVVNNISAVDSVDITSLIDTIYGDITLVAGSTCTVPQTIAAGASYSCEFTATVSGAPGDVENNVVTASGTDDDGNPVSDDDDATVTVTDLPATMNVVKTASPTSVNEPGGDVTFNFTVNNTSQVDSITIDTLNDSIYGDLTAVAGTDCAVPQTIAAGDSYSCSITVNVTGNAGDTETNVVTASGTDDDGNDVSDTDDETVTINDVPSSIEVVKTANPENVSEPGGDVTFTFVVNNTSAADSVTIDTLNDSIYGDLTAVAGSDCTVPQTIAAGGSYSCSITVNVTGNAGDTETNVVTASGTDDDGNPVSDDDDATVTITDLPAAIEIIKTADPMTVDEPGGDVTFSFVVNNLSAVDSVTINTLNDSIYGDLTAVAGSDCSVPQTIAAGGSYSCSFTTFVGGNAGTTHTNVATASGTDDDGNPVSDDDDAEVTVTDLPSTIELIKTADPTTVDEPGGNVTFTFVVKNTSAADSVTINSLTDSIYGDLTAAAGSTCVVGQTLAADDMAAGGADEYTCSITVFVAGNAGETETNVATASGTDDDGNPVSDTDDAVVTINNVQGEIEVVKIADPTSVSEPGGTVSFSFMVNNLSTIDAVTINSLTDTIYGDLNGQGDCSVPQNIAAGGSYTCSITANVTGNAGETHTNVVTASGVDEDGDPVSDDDDATVTIEDVASAIEILKTADPISVDEPGGDVTFTFVVNNLSAADSVTIDSLTDTIYGDLTAVAGSDCVVPQTLAVGGSFSCSITVFVSGNANDVHTNVATASGTDDDGNPVSDDDDAEVTITDVPSSIEVVKMASPGSVDEPGGDVTFSFTVNNTSAVDTVTIESLTDTIYGDLTAVAGTDCSVPQTIAAGDSYSCSITVFVSGNAFDTHTNVVTASGTDDDGEPVTDDDDETVTIDDVPSSIKTTKTANPSSVPETGGDVTFTVVVENTSLVDDVTINTVIDDVFGDVSASCAPALPATLAPTETVSCTFTEFLSGDAGQVHTNVVTATGEDDDDMPVEDEDDEDVPFEDVLPDITIVKSANPTSVPETGGDVVFTFVVTNNSLEDATLDSLIDSDFGDLNGQGNCAVPQPLAGNGGTYTCAITVNLSGDASGPDHNNVVTATGSDDDGNTTTDDDDETVTYEDVLPDVSIVKSANPTSVPETGGDVAFTIVVTNNSLEDATIDSLGDSDFDLSANCADAVGTVLASGASYTCVFTEFISGDASGPDHENTATVVASDNDGNTDTESDDETVVLTDVLPDVSIVKTANPTSVPEPGADVEFTIVVTNNSLEDATIDSLTDSDFDLAVNCADAVGTVLASSASYTCVFTELVAGNVGEDHQNTATVAASDNDGNTDTESDDADVTITNVDPAISVDKTADQAQVFAPGEDVTFTVVINNDSVATDPVTINSLVDSIHGDLNGQGDCSMPQTIQPGASYTCAFAVLVDGDETNVITASGTDDEGTPVSGSDDATVDMINPSLAIEKSTNGFDADAATGPEILEGSAVNWAYVVTNDGDVALENVSVNDDQGVTVTCPQATLAVGESITCTASGVAVANQYANVGTASASHTDVDGDTATPTGSDPSHYFGAAPSVDIVKTFADDSVIAGGAGSSFTLVVTNDGNVDLDNVSVTDSVDARLQVTNVSGTGGASADSDGNAQTVEWLIASLGVGESATITVDFAVGPSVPEALGVPNTATASSDYTDDSDNSTTVSDVDSDTIDILTDVNLSIEKAFDPATVGQGESGTFTIEVANAGPSDAVDVSVTDSVDNALAVTGVTVTSGSGDCSTTAGQEVDCTVDIPDGSSVLITVTYTAAPALPQSSIFNTTKGDEFRFYFVNGSILEGSTTSGIAFLDGQPITLGGGPNDIVFDPPGSDPAFLMHLSCSDAFTGGWGDTDGPADGIDVNWQIASYSITRFNQGQGFFKECGDTPVALDVPNTASATGSDSFGSETVTSTEVSVTVDDSGSGGGGGGGGGDVDTGNASIQGKNVDIPFINNTANDLVIDKIELTWPSGTNRNLRQVRLDGSRIFNQSRSGPSTVIDSGWSGSTTARTLQAGNTETLRFQFQRNAASSPYAVIVTFTDGTVVSVSVP